MTDTNGSPLPITAVILAGGEARRMGGVDKGLVEVAQKPMIEYVINAVAPQVSKLLINANRNQDAYAQYGFPVVADTLEGFHGPLAGMASAMQIVDTDYMLSLPCDSPHVPNDLAQRLFKKLDAAHAEISVAHNGERLQPVFCLLKTSLLDSMLNYLNSGERKIDRWFTQHEMVTADFSDKPETFINVNSPEDIVRLEQEMETASIQ